MTIRKIQQEMGYGQLEPLRKVWVKHFGDGWPHGDAVLPKDKAIALLTILATPTTRRRPEQAAIAAELLRKVQENGLAENTRNFDGIAGKTPAKPVKKQVEKKAPIARPSRRKSRVKHERKPNAVITWLQSVTMLDVVYLATIVTAVYGLWFNLREMGIAFAVPYTLISFHALRMAKNPNSRRTAQAGIAAVIVLEVLTFFIHMSMFNLRIVQAAKANVLPFEYSFWGSLEGPFYIACILSALFSGAGVYAVAVTFSLTTEKHQGKKTAALEAERREKHYTELHDALEESARHWAKLAGQNTHNPDMCDGLARRYFETLNGLVGK